MNIFNKFEALGIFISIAIMAVALSVVRFKTDVFTSSTLSNTTNSAAVGGSVVAVSDGDSISNEENIKNALMDASTPDGTIVDLVIDDVKKGTGDEVVNGSTVSVHYTGTLQDGTKFDSSYDRGEPFSFTVGQGRVIQGWEKGLLGMKVGGQRILVIPGDMAYGNRTVGIIPANATLVFSIDLLEVK